MKPVLLLASIPFLISCSTTGGGQLTPLGAVPHEVTVDLVDRTYTITGETEQDLLAAMRLGGGYSYRWRYRWTYRSGVVDQPSINPGAARETRCEIKDVDITLTFERTLPTWDPPEEPDPGLLAKWEAYERAVKLHGEGHRDIAVDLTEEAIRRLKDLQTEDCSFMRSEAEALMGRIHEKYIERDREYESAEREARTVQWPGRGQG